MLESSERI